MLLARSGRMAKELLTPCPIRRGDYYRSRFAGGTHSGIPFVDGSGFDITSIRDAKVNNDLRSHCGKNLIAQPITIKGTDWRLVDFNTTYPGTVMSGVSAVLQIDSGYSGYVRVGDNATVFSSNASVITRLQAYLQNYNADILIMLRSALMATLPVIYTDREHSPANHPGAALRSARIGEESRQGAISSHQCRGVFSPKCQCEW